EVDAMPCELLIKRLQRRFPARIDEHAVKNVEKIVAHGAADAPILMQRLVAVEDFLGDDEQGSLSVEFGLFKNARQRGAFARLFQAHGVFQKFQLKFVEVAGRIVKTV